MRNKKFDYKFEVNSNYFFSRKNRASTEQFYFLSKQFEQKLLLQKYGKIVYKICDLVSEIQFNFFLQRCNIEKKDDFSKFAQRFIVSTEECQVLKSSKPSDEAISDHSFYKNPV